MNSESYHLNKQLTFVYEWCQLTRVNNFRCVVSIFLFEEKKWKWLYSNIIIATPFQNRYKQQHTTRNFEEKYLLGQVRMVMDTHVYLRWKDRRLEQVYENKNFVHLFKIFRLLISFIQTISKWYENERIPKTKQKHTYWQ